MQGRSVCTRGQFGPVGGRAFGRVAARILLGGAANLSASAAGRACRVCGGRAGGWGAAVAAYGGDDIGTAVLVGPSETGVFSPGARFDNSTPFAWTFPSHGL